MNKRMWIVLVKDLFPYMAPLWAEKSRFDIVLSSCRRRGRQMSHFGFVFNIRNYSKVTLDCRWVWARRHQLFTSLHRVDGGRTVQRRGVYGGFDQSPDRSPIRHSRVRWRIRYDHLQNTFKMKTHQSFMWNQNLIKRFTILKRTQNKTRRKWNGLPAKASIADWLNILGAQCTTDLFYKEENISGRSPHSVLSWKLIPLFMERFQEFAMVRYIKSTSEGKCRLSNKTFPEFYFGIFPPLSKILRTKNK